MFSHQIKTAIDIQATPEAIWRELTNFAFYNDWNPMLQNVRGEARAGSKLKFEVLLGNNKRLKLSAKVGKATTHEELHWTGGSALVIGGTHYFRLEKLSDGQTRLHHGEHFTGLLLPLMAKSIRRSEALYNAMNHALKERMEQQAA